MLFPSQDYGAVFSNRTRQQKAGRHVIQQSGKAMQTINLDGVISTQKSSHSGIKLLHKSADALIKCDYHFLGKHAAHTRSKVLDHCLIDDCAKIWRDTKVSEPCAQGAPPLPSWFTKSECAARRENIRLHNNPNYCNW